MPLIHLSCHSYGRCSFLAHSSDIDDLLEGLDGVLEDWLDGLHDTESSLHIVDLWLHSLDGLHLSGDLNEWLSIIESLEDSSGKGLLDVLDGGGLGNGGVGITSGLVKSDSKSFEKFRFLKIYPDLARRRCTRGTSAVTRARRLPRSGRVA